ncbi:MAG: hypothetical protein M1820_002433 [Bogoriella megaspora]|nr:MAG: hypothetical protein M1820_002433 [Bogoriella megaspora]
MQQEPSDGNSVDEDPTATEADTREHRDAPQLLNTYSEPPNARYGFNVVRNATLQEWMKNPNCSKTCQNTAHNFLLAEAELENSETSWHFKDLREFFKKSQDRASELFFDKENVIVFVTCNAAAHETLRLNAKPIVIIIDEAAQASFTDTMIPPTAFLHSVKQRISAGDHTQDNPVVTSRDRNEVLPFVEVSLFEKLFVNSQRTVTTHVLDVQYPMDRFARPQGYLVWRGA